MNEPFDLELLKKHSTFFVRYYKNRSKETGGKDKDVETCLKTAVDFEWFVHEDPYNLEAAINQRDFIKTNLHIGGCGWDDMLLHTQGWILLIE